MTLGDNPFEEQEEEEEEGEDVIDPGSGVRRPFGASSSPAGSCPVGRAYLSTF